MTQDYISYKNLTDRMPRTEFRHIGDSPPIQCNKIKKTGVDYDLLFTTFIGITMKGDGVNLTVIQEHPIVVKTHKGILFDKGNVEGELKLAELFFAAIKKNIEKLNQAKANIPPNVNFQDCVDLACDFLRQR